MLAEQVGGEVFGRGAALGRFGREPLGEVVGNGDAKLGHVRKGSPAGGPQPACELEVMQIGGLSALGRAESESARRSFQEVMPIVLALSSSLVWGCSDFLGGLYTRRLPLAAVTIVSQGAGFAALLVWLAATGFHVDAGAFAFGALAGIGGAIGLSAFYKGLAVGTMSIVSPVASCGALIPFALSLATGERPAAAAVAGAVIALAGAVLASAAEHRAQGDRRRGAAYAVVSAIAIGLFVYFLGLGVKHGTPLSALLGARVGSLTLLVSGAAALGMPRQIERNDLPGVALVGLLDTTANCLFVLASAGGFLAVVSVLGSLYPVVTVVAAHALLGERIGAVQRGGVALALAGVALVAGG